jgi:hypothetical protein
LVFGVLVAWPLPASAAVEGPCIASFNGVEVERIDSLGSPLELTIDDILTFEGGDEAGTQRAGVELVVGPIGFDEGTTTYGSAVGEFSASIPLEDVAPYGVGLFRVRGVTDNCTAEAWVRVGGKMPLSTLTGITGLGLTLAGLTGQLAAIATRRRRSWPAAAAGGIATGLGVALLGQQLGRLQLSYPSVGLAVAGFALVGGAVAFAMRRRGGEAGRYRVPTAVERDDRRAETRQRRDEERAREAARREQRDAEREDRTRQPEPAATERASRPAATTEGGATEATPSTAENAAAAPSAPYWCYVMSSVEVLDLTQPNRVIAVLNPGTWYLARREAAEWVHVVAGDDLEGWAPRDSIHRHG